MWAHLGVMPAPYVHARNLLLMFCNQLEVLTGEGVRWLMAGCADQQLLCKECIGSARRLQAGRQATPPTHTQLVTLFCDMRLMQVLNPSLEEDFKTLLSVKGADADLSVEARSNDGSVWLVAYSRDNAPTEYYVYDRCAGESCVHCSCCSSLNFVM
jgi:hypothetical protein